MINKFELLIHDEVIPEPPKSFAEAAKFGDITAVLEQLKLAVDQQLLLAKNAHAAFRNAVEYERIPVVLRLLSVYTDEGLRQALTVNQHEALGQTIVYKYKDLQEIVLAAYVKVKLDVPEVLKGSLMVPIPPTPGQISPS